jgi:hypothetical protein
MSATKFHTPTKQQAKLLRFLFTDDNVMSQKLDIGELEGDATVFSQLCLNPGNYQDI